jgi:hypothetical protein
MDHESADRISAAADRDPDSPTRVQVGAKDPDTEEVWIAPDYAEKAFLLSEETRTRGLRELRDAGLLTVRRRQLVAADSFDFRRFRNVYRLNLATLTAPAVEVRGPLHE